MSLRRFLLGSALSVTCLLGCAHNKAAKPAPPPAEPAATAPAPTPPPAAETPPPAAETPAPAAPAPECTAPEDCSSKGAAAKSNQWACTDGKCVEEKKSKKKKK